MIPRIFPAPKKTVTVEGKEASLPLAACTKNKAWGSALNVLTTSFQKIHGVALTESEGGIILSLSPSVPANGYRIEVSDAFRIFASTEEGILYGIATALQILSVREGHLFSPALLISDHPDKDFRGLMLDLARKFHEPRAILKIIDLCFFYKIKYLHLHVMDDQSYTLPSDAFPLLPTKDRSYTKEQIAEFNRYASARGVYLVPELEIPGHATTINTVYPELFINQVSEDLGEMYTENGDRISAKSIICAGSERTTAALESMLDEICTLFPDTPYIHIGGDEADIQVWDSCEVCKRYMHEHGIKDVQELYSDFTARIARLVLSKGRTPIVWEGFPKKGAERIPRETVVIAWESHYHQAKYLLDEGFQIINASWQPLYIVSSLVRRWYAKDILAWDVYNLQHWWEGSAAAKSPIHLPPTNRVLGAQVCAWGCTFEQEIGLILENLAALSERTWNVDGTFDIDETVEAMEPLLSIAAKLIQ